jgi:hypothetical protein
MILGMKILVESVTPLKSGRGLRFNLVLLSESGRSNMILSGMRLTDGKILPGGNVHNRRFYPAFLLPEGVCHEIYHAVSAEVEKMAENSDSDEKVFVADLDEAISQLVADSKSILRYAPEFAMAAFNELLKKPLDRTPDSV